MVHDDKFLRDAAFNLFVAGRDTITSGLTWFFWLVATHPLVEAKILEEIEKVFGAAVREKCKILGMEDVKKLVYLHGALCEGLRLFPPVPIERKQSLKRDTLPSGHYVNPNSIILLFTYAMGRFEEIWGKDCLEFKPERWISEKGETIHVPSYKFISLMQVQGHAWKRRPGSGTASIAAAESERSHETEKNEGDGRHRGCTMFWSFHGRTENGAGIATVLGWFAMVRQGETG
ncbi:alkane hydroxylase MAH1-like [Arachis duranensis]|uniref:Alkane hydroxylase MAH1-like n=1 Tax=Arachis duranensis TaxID=130453 RepID=A0A9C6WR95_ARADU|nr:alkane hydroxylase MAH1-like [Arachis duranensis]